MNLKKPILASSLAVLAITFGIIPQVGAATKGNGDWNQTYASKTSNSKSSSVSPNIIPGGGGVPSCQSPQWTVDSLGLGESSTQYSSTPSFMWGFQLTLAGQDAVGYPQTASIQSGSITSPDGIVHTVNPGYWYSPHTLYGPYLYHGSFSSYQTPDGVTHTLQMNSIVSFDLRVAGPYGILDNYAYCELD